MTEAIIKILTQSLGEAGRGWKGFVGSFHLYGYIAVKTETLSAPRDRNPWSDSGPLEALNPLTKDFSIFLETFYVDYNLRMQVLIWNENSLFLK